jgi:hypothetical protein
MVEVGDGDVVGVIGCVVAIGVGSMVGTIGSGVERGIGVGTITGVGIGVAEGVIVGVGCDSGGVSLTGADVRVGVGVAVTTTVWITTTGVEVGTGVISEGGDEIGEAGSEPQVASVSAANIAAMARTRLVLVTRVIVPGVIMRVVMSGMIVVVAVIVR